MSTCKIFLAGPSGSGKTSVGNHVARAFGWLHVDMEFFHVQDETRFKLWTEDPAQMFARAVRNTIVTWGYTEPIAHLAKRVVEAGAEPVWLWGDLELLKESRARRGDTPNWKWLDPVRVDDARRAITGWRDVNAFNDDGTRKPLHALSLEILKG